MKKITLAHGSGGSEMHRLIDSIFIKELGNPALHQKKDSAILKVGEKTIAFTTDSYVVKPLFFPGGDIGSLAVYGTVNDLSVCGARPLYLSLGLVIEEGLDAAVLERVARSIREAAKRAAVLVVTGDTKVVEKGSCDKLFINTSGIGEVYYEGLSIDRVKTGDAVILSGGIGEHAISVLSKREDLSFASNVRSDAAPLNGLTAKALAASDEVRFMRDPTRGGLATTLNEIVQDRGFGIALDERLIPVKAAVRGACEMLGLDPLYLSCEGRFLAVVSGRSAKRVLKAIRSDALGRQAAVIGAVTSEYKGRVVMRTSSGGKRIVGMLTGEQLPRIC